MDYESMTVAALEKENQKLSEKREAIRQEQKKLVAVMDKRQAQEEAQRKYDRMSDPERAALAQVITKAGGIESEEGVGVPR